MSEPSTSSKVSKTEDDSAVKSSSSTDLKRGAFGKGRALSSKALGSKRISTSTTNSADLDKEKIKKSLLEQPEKKKSKSKDAVAAPDTPDAPISEPQPERITIQPLDEATQNALKKRSKRRGSDSSGDPNKAQKSKRTSKEVEVEEKPAPVPSTKRRDSHDESSDSESSKSKKKHRRSQSPSKQIPQLPVAVAVMPPILSDRSGPEDDKPLSTRPAFPPPLTPTGSSTSVGRSPSPTRAPSNPLLPQASPRPFSMAPLSARSSGADSPSQSPGLVRPLPPGAQRDITPPPPPPSDTPDVSDESLPPPPPSEDASTEDAPTPAASTDSLNITGDFPIHTLKMSDSQSSLPLAQITVSSSTSSIGADSEDEDSVKESKKEKRRKNRPESVEVDPEPSSKHTRERSGTKGRRDSDTVSPLAIASIPPVSPTSTPLSSSRGLMRLNRTPRGENVSSPRGQILIINPAGDASSQATDVAPPPPHTTVIAAIPIALPGLSDSSPSVSSLASSSATRRDSVDVSTDDLPAFKGSLNSSMSGSLSEMPPPPPPMPTIGVPPPPPMPSRGAAAVSVVPRRDSDAQYDGEIAVARTRTRRVVPQVEAAVKLWDSRATNFEQRMVSEVAHKTAPEELLEFPADDLLLEIVNSQLQHYPALDPSAPPSVRDCYSSYTSQLKIICRQSLWYGTETSPKDRFKEYETRMSRAKVEAAQAAQAAAAQAAAHPVADIRNKASSANARRPSISRGTGSEASIARRASRSIKMTNSSSIAEDVASALPDLNEDEDSSAQESNEGEESASETSVPTVEVRFFFGSHSFFRSLWTFSSPYIPSDTDCSFSTPLLSKFYHFLCYHRILGYEIDDFC